MQKHQINDFLSNIIPPPYRDDFLAITKMHSLDAGEYFIREGEMPHKYGLVLSGLFRYVYISEKGNEFTKNLIPEGNFISSYSAMIHRTPSHFFIEALKPAEILVFRQEQWNQLREKDRFWDQLLIQQLEKGFTTKEKREREFLLLDAETRYRNFLREFPQAEHTVSQKIIASYLGIHPESLSRIRKKIAGLT